MKWESYNNIQKSKINEVHAYLNIISYLSNASDQVQIAQKHYYIFLWQFQTSPTLTPFPGYFNTCPTLAQDAPPPSTV